ncbi:hypothetical protein CAP31_03250 [Sulfuriferula sp. AH1]|nr:hypothetical protein CAP31_03250 [Sulfuriferula sp. AH1]
MHVEKKKPMTAAERQRSSRAKRKLELFESCHPLQLSMLLSAEATRALELLGYEMRMTQKGIIEDLLIRAVKNRK